VPQGKGASAARSVPAALWLSLALAASVVVVYAPVWQYDFVSWDDPQYVSENPHVLGGLSWQSLRWAFTTAHAGLWIPLTWISFMVDIDVYGAGAGGHHFTNVLLHLANTLLLFGLLHRMTGALGRSALVAALFAVHPLHVESVAWVTERKDVLSTVFGLLAVWGYVGYVKQPRVARYLGVVALFALSLTAKPMLVTLPFVLLLLDIWPLGRFPVFGDAGPGHARPTLWGQRAVLKRPLLEKVPLLLVAIACSVITVAVQRQAGAVSVLEALPLEARIENALVSYVVYVMNALWPAKLAGLYPYHPLPVTWVLASVVLLVGISVGVFLAFRRHPYLFVGWAWYLATLLPVIGLVQVGIQARADRFTYFPLLGVFIMVAWGVHELMARLRQRNVVLAAAALSTSLVLAVTARAQVRHWRDSSTFWQHTVEVTRENARAHGNLGLVLAARGDQVGATAEYLEALRIRPELADVHNNLANSLVEQGRGVEAMAHYTEALHLDPDYLPAHNGLGALLDDQGRFEEAIVHYNEALRIEPGSAMAHNNLGVALVNQGRADEAVSHFVEAARIEPNDVDYRYNAAILLDRVGRSSEAVAHLRAVLRIDSGHGEARRLLQLLEGRGPSDAPGV
jgi:tetratricopeptide (TPR) repeat protein